MSKTLPLTLPNTFPARCSKSGEWNFVPKFLPTQRLKIYASILAFIFLGSLSSRHQPTLAGQEAVAADQEYNESTDRLRAAIVKLKRSQAKFYFSKVADAGEFYLEWDKAAIEGEQAAADLQDAAIDVLFKAAHPTRDQMTVARIACREKMEKGEYELVYKISKRLCDLDPDETEYFAYKTRAALITNRFVEAKETFALDPGELSTFIPAKEMMLMDNIDVHIANYENELKIREQEAKADDLPIVELTTSKGKIVIELFENQAPGHVANFISIIDTGYYEGILFHRVVTGFVAQAGGFTMSGRQNVGYNIYDEHGVEDARHHFRGSLSMASVSGKPNSASSQFFLTFSPTPMLDGRHTCFGRITEGLDVLDSLTPTRTMDDEGTETPIEEIVPDRIISARVIRKRDHEYKPIRVAK